VSSLLYYSISKKMSESEIMESDKIVVRNWSLIHRYSRYIRCIPSPSLSWSDIDFQSIPEPPIVKIEKIVKNSQKIE